MEYKGKLYGHLGNRRYFDTGKTADDWDNLEKRIAQLEAENQALRQPPVISSVCDIHKGTRCERSFSSYTDGKCRECGGQAN